MKLKVGLLLAVLSVGGLLGQDEAQFPGWMKTIGGNMGATKKAIEAKSVDAATSAAKVADAFDKVHGFYKTKAVSDAEQAAATAKGAAADVARFAQAGEFDKASTAFAALGGTCKGCHEAHREKAADGSYKLK
ncbi:hypothetical protein [Paludibaculum fermentans]|uniref:hypothetical protein n=1 Tax=Paludibaculum fermentans TaxID=1473598 RepID=UPI003EBA596D